MTDGILELFNNKKELFGIDKLEIIFKENANKPVKEIIESIMDKSKEWSGDEKQNDDITFGSFKLI